VCDQTAQVFSGLCGRTRAMAARDHFFEDLIWRNDVSGTYWIVPAVVISFLVGVARVWVMLVEVQG
jgi:hypothetical protein